MSFFAQKKVYNNVIYGSAMLFMIMNLKLGVWEKFDFSIIRAQNTLNQSVYKIFWSSMPVEGKVAFTIFGWM